VRLGDAYQKVICYFTGGETKEGRKEGAIFGEHTHGEGEGGKLRGKEGFSKKRGKEAGCFNIGET